MIRLSCPEWSASTLMTLLGWTILLSLAQNYCHAASVGDSGTDSGIGMDHMPLTLGVLIASAAVLICGIIIVMLCAEFCVRQSGFKDFDNDAFTEDTMPAVVAPASEFTMYPPVENTPDSMLANPIVFEPLPDLTPMIEQRHYVGNAWRLRPRLIHEGQERSESIDSLDQIIQNDSVQQKLKLQNLMTNSRHQVPRSQLQYIKELGNGWFGKVLQGEGHSILPGHKKTKVVIQMLKEETDTQDQLAFLEEVMPFRDTDHPNVLNLLGQCVDTEPFLNVLELCPFGDLKTYLRSHRVAMESFNEKGLPLKFASDMAAGLQALHQQGFIHRDFATRNCMLASDLSVKVGDYGISEEKFKEDYYTDRHGDAIPIRWLSPESLQVTAEDVYVRRITKEANIWTFGIALWEVMTFGSMPYSDLTNSHVLRLVVVEKCVKLRRPDVAVNNIERLYQLLQLCWGEPEHRPSLRELRIMLLHLLSRKEEFSSAAFDKKWNQLMPRRSPRVSRATPPQPWTGDSVRTITGMKLPQAALSMSSGPSVLSGEDLDSSMNELNASQLGLAGSRGIHANGGMYQHDKGLQPTSPVNELSLEAEFSAANVAAADSSDDDIFVGAPKEGAEKLMTAEDLLSPIRATGLEVSKDDSMKNTMPDIVTTSAKAPEIAARDFTTSTPKKMERDIEVEVYTTALGGSSVQVSSDVSQVTGTYHTAQSNTSSLSSTYERSLSLDYEDRSFMAPGKFADLLQTVAMTTSIDEDTASECSPMPMDLTEEDVFRSVASPDINAGDLQPIGRVDLAEMGSDSGEVTPRNTPTPPVATSFAPLLDAADLSSVLMESSTSMLEEEPVSEAAQNESASESADHSDELGSVETEEQSSLNKQGSEEKSSQEQQTVEEKD